MKYIRNKRYFFPFRLTVAALHTVSGMLCTYIGLERGVQFPLFLGVPLFVIGFVLFILGIVTRLTKGTALDADIAKYTRDIADTAKAALELPADTAYIQEPVVLASYHYNTKDARALVKIDKDGVPRTNLCLALVLLFTEDTLYWYDHKFSLVFKEDRSQTMGSVKYADIKSAVLEDMKVSCETTKWNTISVMCRNLKIDCGETTLMECFLKNNPDVDAALAALKKLVKAAKKA